MTDLREWGWPLDHPLPDVDPSYPDTFIARVTMAAGNGCRVIAEQGEYQAEPSGRLARHLADTAERPVVGDWALIQPMDGTDRAVIHEMLPRAGVIERRQVDQDRRESAIGFRQVLAANVDVALVVAALDGSVRPRRIERYLTLAYNGGVTPLVVLTKSDLSPDPLLVAEELRIVAPGVDVLPVSVRDGGGLDDLRGRLIPGRTHVLLGPSGVGKSTLINALSGRDVQATGEVRAWDAKGRHTTTTRELFRLPEGALVIDTPGLRAVGLTGEGEGLDLTFPDIAALAKGCRFRDCRHQGEPGCAVEAAARSGALNPGRLEGYRKLLKETAYEHRRADPTSEKRHGKRFAKMSKEVKRMDKRRY